MELAVVPVYQSEIMPREIRGFAVGSYQFSLMVWPSCLTATATCVTLLTLLDGNSYCELRLQGHKHLARQPIIQNPIRPLFRYSYCRDGPHLLHPRGMVDSATIKRRP